MPVITKYNIPKTVRYIRDADTDSYSSANSAELRNHFINASILFRVRVEQLLSLSHTTTEAEADSTKVMLDVLVEAKRRIK